MTCEKKINIGPQLFKPRFHTPANKSRRCSLRAFTERKLHQPEEMRETTLRGTFGHLKPILEWAVNQGNLKTMPIIPSTKRGKGVKKAMRGRPITGEELDRMISKVPEKRKREPEKWQRLLLVLNISGLRLGEALKLSWDDGAEIRFIRLKRILIGG